ncbi:MAG: nitrous oxide reductase accessory protein NosL [Phycisphaeraceae bacterium]|nr:nitrous oxide reductase accessory protein NosL [Phycisphaeraceae bacterium]
MNRRRRTLAAAAVAASLWLLTACSDSGPLAAPEILLGRDTCTVCGMAVSDGRYAAAVVVRHQGRDQTLLLDDIGELPAVTIPPHDQVALFVRDESTQRWLVAEAAHYVRSEALRTPMGFGVAALATPEQAEARRAEIDGELLAFDALRPPALDE